MKSNVVELTLPSLKETVEAKQWNVYYRNKESNRLCRYCVFSMDYGTAYKFMNAFNDKYPDKAYPNGKGFYPWTQAWVDYH